MLDTASSIGKRECSSISCREQQRTREIREKGASHPNVIFVAFVSTKMVVMDTGCESNPLLMIRRCRYYWWSTCTGSRRRKSAPLQSIATHTKSNAIEMIFRGSSSDTYYISNNSNRTPLNRIVLPDQAIKEPTGPVLGVHGTNTMNEGGK